MDEEMEDIVNGGVFTAYEIDLDYEFDACMHFDLSRDESLTEAREAEIWFETAKSYPPSPFVARLVLGEDIALENVCTTSKLNDAENMTLLNDDFDDSRPVYSVLDVTGRGGEEICGGTYTNLKGRSLQGSHNPPVVLPTGLTFYNHGAKDIPKGKTKSFVRPFSSRSSTLMKPTASQLAKQNQPHQVTGTRFQMSLVQSTGKSSNNSSGVESQAAKRQKLEGGHLCKVADMNEQTNLVHKAPKKDGTFEGDSKHAKLKLTIPREPELVTAHRAQRMRPKKNSELQSVTLTSHRFKARPLNRKILEAPSLPLPEKSTPRLPDFQVFHLKTLERAMQHSSAVSSSLLHHTDTDKGLHKPNMNLIAENRNKEVRRKHSMEASKAERCQIMNNFKAHPLNKKILSSKGDIGVTRNTKRETTVPMEFNFHTEKRIQHNLPIELFSKLSLTSGLQPKNGTELKLPQHTHISLKGPKENRLAFPEQEQKMMDFVKDKPLSFRAERTQCEGDRSFIESRPPSSMRRLGLR